MKKRFSLGNIGIAVATFGMIALCWAPAVAQTGPVGTQAQPRLNPNSGASGPRAQPVPRSRVVRPTTQAAPQTQTQTLQKPYCDPYANNQRRGHSQAPFYYPPVYPGPNAPLPPQGTYFIPNPYNGYGYGPGSFNNSYYNNGYYNNGYNQGGGYQQNPNNVTYPSFQRY